MSISAASLLAELIACPSVTPADAGALDLLDKVLTRAGFTTHRLVFSSAGTPDIANLYARIGSGAPNLLFAGHTDVVPPGDASLWRFDPFSGHRADGHIWGRGAVDMKGAIAAKVVAVQHYLDTHGPPEGSISFLITGDEEGPAINGTAKLLEWALARGERFDHCILGEPTNAQTLGDMIKIGRRGSLSGEIIVHGKQGHVAYPHLARNPIPELMEKLRALTANPFDQGSANFDASNLEITSMDVDNRAANVIPASAKAKFNIRFNDLWTLERLRDEISARVGPVPGRCELVFAPSNASAFLNAAGPFTRLVSEAIKAQTHRTPVLSTSGGTSDARFICHACPVVEFGLVGLTMHQVDERVAVADVETLASIYHAVIERYFASAM